MLVVLDTNIFISALILPNSRPATLVDSWEDKKFTLLTSETQIEELRRVSRYPKVRERINYARMGKIINELWELATIIDDLPTVDVSPDPYDNYLLSIASGGVADYLVTGDKKDLLSLKKFDGVAIISVSDFLQRLGV